MTEATKKAAAAWEALSEADRKPYVYKNEVDRKRYEK